MTSTGTVVKIVTPVALGQETYYFSPGCSVTETVNVGVKNFGASWSNTLSRAITILEYMQTEMSHTIRIDGQIDKYNDAIQDGLEYWPAFDPYNLTYAVKKAPWSAPFDTFTLTIASREYAGFVKSVTTTQRSGEGNLVDVAITFEVGYPNPD